MPSQLVRTAVVVPSSAPSSSMLSKSSSSSSSTTAAAYTSMKSSSSMDPLLSSSTIKSSSSWLDRRSEAALGVAALAGDGHIPSGSKRKADSFSSSSSLSVMERVPTISSSSDSMLPSRSSSSASIATQSIAATASSSNQSDAELLRERFRYAAYLKWRQELVAAKRVAANNDHASSINKNTSLEVKNS